MSNHDSTRHMTGGSGTKAARRRLRLLLLFVTCFLIWAGLTIMEQRQMLEQQSSEFQGQQQALADAMKLNAKYKQEIIRLHDDEYKAQRIRKDLHMTKEGEILFIPVE